MIRKDDLSSESKVEIVNNGNESSENYHRVVINLQPSKKPKDINLSISDFD